MRDESDREAPRNRETLKKQEILRGYQSFQSVFQKGKKLSGNYLVLFYLSDSQRKVGFTVSKKYRKAVDRNRMKRVMKELYRKNKSAFPTGRLILFARFFQPLPSAHNLLSDLENILDKKLTL